MPFKRIFTFPLLFLFVSHAATAAGGQTPLVEEAAGQIKQSLPWLRLEEKDLRVPPGWDLPMTIPTVENLFARPLDVPARGAAWLDRVESATATASLFSLAVDLLKSTPTTTSFSSNASSSKKVLFKNAPVEIKPFLQKLHEAVRKAQPHLDRAVHSVSDEARAGFLSLHGWPVKGAAPAEQEISSRRIKRKYEDMKPFLQNDLLFAAQEMFRTIDTVLPGLRALRSETKKRIKIMTPEGAFLIGGVGNDIYEKKDLDNVVVLIDLGGNNVYNAPVAAARENQIRVVIDLGADVTVNKSSDVHGNAGSGVFGIGIFVLPQAHGNKSIHSGSFAQGCGIGGVGALIVNGPARLSGGKYVQGAGSFGVGLLSGVQGTGSTYEAVQTGQGSALVRGVGLFKHQGDNADIRGGLVQPDPREPKGALSMCQGVGFGHRAYSGGGVGIASVTGDDVSVRGSYFSQGVGYWHAFGVFRLRGHRGFLQARRYDMGSGVHSAFGHFELLGNSNRVHNWGVGPAYGWDHSVGSALIHGEDNEVQVDWGAGVASIGSLSFSYYKSNRGRFKLCDFGKGQFFRNEPSTSLQLMRGTDNKIQCLGAAETGTGRRTVLANTWGLISLENTSLVEDLKLPPAEWPDLPQEKATRQEAVDLQARLRGAVRKPPLEEIGDLLDVAGAFSLDKDSPKKARLLLVALEEEKVPFLIDALEPAAVDQVIQQSVMVPSHGDAAARAMIARLDTSVPQKKALLINLLRLHRPSIVFPALLDQLTRVDEPRIKSSLLRTLGQMLNKDTGTEPGLRALLGTVAEALENPDKEEVSKRARQQLSKAVFSEAFGLLSTCCGPTEKQRQRFLTEGPDDITTPVNEKGAVAFMAIAGENRNENAARLRRELTVLNEMEPVVRIKAADILKTTQTTELYGALVTLGQIAHPDDVMLVAPFMGHERAVIRDAAAVALGRMGEGSLPVFRRAFETGKPRTRSLVLAAVQQSVTSKSLPILMKGLQDPDPMVRLTAVATLNDLPESLRSHKEKLIRTAKKRAATDPDPDVRLAISLLR